MTHLRGNMIKKILLTTALAISLVGCSIHHGVKKEIESPIDRSKVGRIVNGETTANEILRHFLETGKLSNFFYAHCEKKNTLNFLLFSKEDGKCNILLVTFDKKSGIVVPHRMFLQE